MNLSAKDGFKSSIPIMIGYLPVAMAFGILSKSSGLNLIECAGFSIILYAGASQFIGVSMLALGAGVSEIVLTTFLLNFRHFFMSASLVSKLDKIHPLMKPMLSFGVTDEVFSVASFADGQLTSRFLLALQIFSYTSWVIGTITGYLLGNVLPKVLQLSMGIGLYALFVSLLVPEIKKSSKALVISLIAACLNLILRWAFSMPQGWSIVVAIVLTCVVGVIIYGKESYE